MLDAIQQRVLGVLIEKELTGPDSYPLTENSLLSGCNQKSNREPEMVIEQHEIHEALVSMREAGWVTRIDGSARSSKYRHNADTMLGLDLGQKSVLCELLVRGPQAPGALKPRVARMGYSAQPAEILDVLEGLAQRGGSTPVVELQAKRPRERDCRWGHLMGPQDQPTATGELEQATVPPQRVADAAPPPPHHVDEDGRARIDQLERQVAALHQEVYRLRKLVEGRDPSS